MALATILLTLRYSYKLYPLRLSGSRGILGEGMQAEAQFTLPPGTLKAAATDEPVRLDSLRYLPGNGTFTARTFRLPRRRYQIPPRQCGRRH